MTEVVDSVLTHRLGTKQSTKHNETLSAAHATMRLHPSPLLCGGCPLWR